jgi:hypothetical protein
MSGKAMVTTKQKQRGKSEPLFGHRKKEEIQGVCEADSGAHSFCSVLPNL